MIVDIMAIILLPLQSELKYYSLRRKKMVLYIVSAILTVLLYKLLFHILNKHYGDGWGTTLPGDPF